MFHLCRALLLGLLSTLMSEKEYGAASVLMLNREDQSERKYLCYPITRIELFDPDAVKRGDHKPSRVFVIDGDRWKEVQ